MMKHTKNLIIIITIAFFSVFAENATAQDHVSNIRVRQSEENLIVMYDLSERADVEVYFSADGGRNFTGPLQYVSGSVGTNLAPEKNKMFLWYVVRELGYVDIEEAVIKIVAAAIYPRKRTILAYRPDYNPLISVRRNVYQLDKGITESEFKYFMDMRLYREMTPLTRDNAQLQMARADDNALHLYNRGRPNRIAGGVIIGVSAPWCALGGAGIPGVSTGVALISRGNMQTRHAVDVFNNSIDRADVTRMLADFNYQKGVKRNRIGNICLLTYGSLVVGGAYLGGLAGIYDGDAEAVGIGALAAACAGAPLLFTGINFKINANHLMRGNEPIFYDNLSQSDLSQMISDNYRKSETRNTLGNVLLISYGTGVSATAILAGIIDNSWNSFWFGMGAGAYTGIPLLATGIGLKVNSKQLIRQAEYLQQNSSVNNTGLELKFGVTSSGGLGMTLKF